MFIFQPVFSHPDFPRECSVILEDSKLKEMDDELQVNPTDGSLTKGLKISLNNTVQKLKGGWKQSTFVRCFPSLATHHEGALETIRNNTLQPLMKALIFDLNSVIDEDLAEPLSRLSSLNKSNSNSSDYVAWRPSGDPEEDMRAHDAEVLRCEKQRLEEILAAHKKKRLQLFEQVRNGRSKCEQNNMQIDKIVQNLEDIQDACSKAPAKRKISFLEEENLSWTSSEKRKVNSTQILHQTQS